VKGNTYTYDSYGIPTVTGTTANPFQFTGRELDAETGIYEYRARQVDRIVRMKIFGTKAGAHP